VRSLPLVASAAFALHAAASEPASWRIDSARSEARFEVTLRLPVHADGRFKKMDGEVTALPDFKRSVRVRLDARELKMGGPDWVQSYTVSEQFLDTGRYPAIEFQSLPFSEQVLISGGDLAGTLTLKAVSKPVLFKILPSTCRRPGFTCPIVVAGTLNRSDFGMNSHRWSLRDAVRFYFQLRFEPHE